MTKDLIERLMLGADDAERDCQLRSAHLMREAAESLSTQTGETGLVGWREALEPFANALEEWGDDERDCDTRDIWEHPLSMLVRISDFRRAANALMSSPPTPSPDPEQAPTRPSVEGDYRGNLARALFEAANGKNLIAWSDATRDFWLSRADQALAIPKASASDGSGDWVTVPRKPTEAMLQAGPLDRHEAIGVWTAMLSAAPAPTPTTRDQALEEAELIAKLQQRKDQDFDGECHLTNDEADMIIAALQPQSPSLMGSVEGATQNEARVVQELSRAFGEPIHIRPRDYLEKVLAGLFGRQPDMSGDQRKRLNSRELAEVGRVADSFMKALIARSSPTIAPPDPVARQMAEALRNMIALAEPHFTSAAETLALNESVNALLLFDGGAGR